MHHLFRPFIVLAAIGFVASIGVHVLTLFGIEPPFASKLWTLHVGTLVVWGPALIALIRMTRGAPRKGYWKAALRGCPAWMRYTLYGVFGYSLFNIFAFFALGLTAQGPIAPLTLLRTFSGDWLILYFAPLALMYSARQTEPERAFPM